MDCDIRKKSQSSYKKIANAYEGKVDKVFDWAADFLRKYDTKGWVIPTHVQNDLADMMNAFNARKNGVYRAADDVKKYFDTFDEKDSTDLVKALNGDLQSKHLSEKALNAYKRVRALIDSNADELIAAGALDEKSKIADYLKRFYSKHMEDKAKLAKIFNSRVYKRKNMSYEERIAMGMIEDPNIVIPRTLAEQRLQLIKADFFKQLDETFGEDMPLGEDYVKIDDVNVGAGIKKYGALSGKYVPYHVKKMLDDAHILKDELGFLEKNIYPIVDHIKVNVTVKNPVTHLYNVLSNIQLSALQGTIQHLPAIFKMMKDDPKGFDALLKELEPFGLDSMLNDMEDIEIMSSNKGVNIVKTIIGNMYFAKKSMSGKALRHIYDWEDKIFKVAAYHGLKQDKESFLGRALNEEEKLHLYKEATAPYANYSTPLPGAFKILDKTGLSPFLHYIYKSTPAVARLIAKNPAKFAAIQVLLATTGASIFSDNEEALKPDWAGKDSKINLFGAKDWVRFSNGWYWNAGRMMPGMKMGAIDTQGGFVGGTLDIINGKTPLGYNIGGKYDSTTESLWKRFAALAENYAPSLTFGRYGQRTLEKLSDNPPKNYYKEDMSWTELIARAAGIRKFNESDEVAKKIRVAKNRYKHFEKEDPSNKMKYLREFKTSLDSIEKQARRRSVVATKPKSRSKKMVDTGIPKQLIKLKF